MTQSIMPFAALLHAADGTLTPTGAVTERRVSDLRGLYADEAAWQRAVEEGDALVYRVVGSVVPEVVGEVPFSITSIMAGVVGDEFFMTKGHFHTAYQGEVYIGMAGVGVLLLYDGAQAKTVEIRPGVAAYIPPDWGHRTVNVGAETFRFMSVYPGDAGHDYARVAAGGLGARIVQCDGSYEVSFEL